ncbi:hypothetical protein OTU49_010418 [Cherax quadricarinatus]|uniref:Uncharacterized protein n=1 Tax=Cherax quadricarinatus TaxID=27406 RepID=A0AAW0W8H6_CHEQU
MKFVLEYKRWDRSVKTSPSSTHNTNVSISSNTHLALTSLPSYPRLHTTSLPQTVPLISKKEKNVGSSVYSEGEEVQSPGFKLRCICIGEIYPQFVCDFR